MDDADLLEVLVEAATEIRSALDGLADWGLAGTKPGRALERGAGVVVNDLPLTPERILAAIGNAAVPAASGGRA